MITREAIISEIAKIPEPLLDELYRLIKAFEAKKRDDNGEPEQSLMAKLRGIKISASSDFSQKVDLYASGGSQQ